MSRRGPRAASSPTRGCRRPRDRLDDPEASSWRPRATWPLRPSSSPCVTGQPKFRSTMSAPAASTIRAASAIDAGSEPKIWIASGCSSEATRRYPSVLSLRCSIPAQRHHLGADEARAEAAALAAERLHADARHRREDEPRGDLHVADRPGLTKIDVHHGHGRGRSVLRTRRHGSYHSRPRATARMPRLPRRRTGSVATPRRRRMYPGGHPEGRHPHPRGLRKR